MPPRDIRGMSTTMPWRPCVDLSAISPFLVDTGTRTGLLPTCHWFQGRSDGGYIGIYTPPPKKKKSAQVNFLWGKYDVRTANQQFYTPKKLLCPQNKFLASPLTDFSNHLDMSRWFEAPKLPGDFPVTSHQLPQNFAVTRVMWKFRRSRRNGIWA